ncbi:hypothetical protein BU17DRAFT_47005, partial [Hysterangium stoloniferum]
GTQAEQDKDDEKARKKAQHDLEKSWMDRLQLISVIATFFASAEAQMLSITTPSQGDSSPVIQQISNAGFTSAFVFHSFAAMLSFFAAFVLVRYQVHEAKRETDENERGAEKQQVWSSDPHLVIRRVGHRRQEPPVNVLHKFHSVCVYITVVGFIMAAIGIICFVWAQQPRSVGIFTSVCVGVCALTGLVVACTNSKDIEAS